MRVLILILSLFVTAPVWSVAETDEASGVTIDALLKREEVGHVIIHKEQGFAVFERVMARDTGQTPLPYMSSVQMGEALKKMYMVDLHGKRPPEPLFPQESKAGYFLAPGGKRSPDGRYLAVYRLKDGVLHPGVFDTRKRRAKFFEISDISSTPFLWLSDSEFAVQTFSGMRGSQWFVRAYRAYAAAQERGWRDGAVTASPPIGSGVYADRIDVETPVRRLVSVDIRSGAVTEILKGDIWADIPLSPDRERLAVLEKLETQALRESALGLVQSVQFSLVFRDRDGAALSRYRPAEGAQLRFSGWSAASDRALITERYYGENPRETHRVVRVDGQETLLQLPTGAEHPFWAGDVLVYLSAPAENDRQDWIAVDGSGTHKVLTEEFSDESARPAATSASSVFFLSEGDLWRIDLDGQRANLTEQYDTPFNVVQRSKDASIRDNIYLRSIRRKIRLDETSISDVVFETSRKGRSFIATFSDDGSINSFIKAPAKAVNVEAHADGSVIFLLRDLSAGAALAYKGMDAAEEVLLYEFNKHLAGLRTAREPVRLDHSGVDGARLHSWLYLPPDHDGSKAAQHPLIVIPYAGTTYSDTPPSTFRTASIWDAIPMSPTVMELFAARGYAVLLPSIPLSPYGQADDPMRKIPPAIMGAVDAALATGFVDKERLALSGHSYGGYSVLSTITQTDRFKAAIASAPVVDLTSNYNVLNPITRIAPFNPKGVAERARILWSETGQGRMVNPPWVDRERYIRNSPIHSVDRIDTPLLLIHSPQDTAVGFTQSEQLFTALLRLEKDALFVRYWGENHSIRQPQNQRDMWQRVFDFLEDNSVRPGPKAVH